jgi:hypothetical protein
MASMRCPWTSRRESRRHGVSLAPTKDGYRRPERALVFPTGHSLRSDVPLDRAKGGALYVLAPFRVNVFSPDLIFRIQAVDRGRCTNGDEDPLLVAQVPGRRLRRANRKSLPTDDSETDVTAQVAREFRKVAIRGKPAYVGAQRAALRRESVASPQTSLMTCPITGSAWRRSPAAPVLASEACRHDDREAATSRWPVST